MATPNPIPTVDLTPFTIPPSTSPSSASARHTAALSLSHALHRNGCIGITGHGVPPALLQRGFEVAKALFDLPLAEKQKAPHPKGAVPHRGYSAVGMEKAFTKEELEGGEGRRREGRRVVDFKVCLLVLFTVDWVGWVKGC